MIIDRSPCLTSGGRFKQEQLLHQQHAAIAEPPLPAIQYGQEQASQAQSDSMAGNSQIPKDMLRNFATNGFRKLTGSQRAGPGLEDPDVPKSEQRKHSEPIQITKSVNGPPVPRQHTLPGAQREAASHQAGFYGSVQASQREARQGEAGSTFTPAPRPPSQTGSLGGPEGQTFPDLRTSHGSELRDHLHPQSRERAAKRGAERSLPEQTQVSSFSHYSATTGSAVRQKAGFALAAPPQSNSRLKQIPAAVRTQVQQQNFTSLYSQLLGETPFAASSAQSPAKGPSAYQGKYAGGSAASSQCKITINSNQKTSQMGATASNSKFRAGPAAVRNVASFGSQNPAQQRAGASSSLAFADRGAIAAHEQQRRRNNASECNYYYKGSPIKTLPSQLNDTAALPQLQRFGSAVEGLSGTLNYSLVQTPQLLAQHAPPRRQGADSVPVGSASQPPRPRHPADRSPAVALREDSGARGAASGLALRDQARSSNQVPHGTASGPAKIPSSENLRDAAQSQRHNSTTAIFRNQILHGQMDPAHAALAGDPNDRTSAYQHQPVP